MEHIISVLVENRFGVLAHIAGLFSGRGFNIDSLAVGETEDPSVSRMTIVVKGDDAVVEQILKQLNRLVDIISVENLTAERHVERELILAKISANAQNRREIIEISEVFRTKIVDFQENSLTIEASGSSDKIEALLNVLQTYGIQELVRTGAIAIGRGSNK